MKNPFLHAVLSVLVLSFFIWRYVMEFDVLSNTLELKELLLISMGVMLVIVVGGIVVFRSRFLPWDEHYAEVVMLIVFGLLFAPLFGSILNRSMGKNTQQTFELVSEKAYFSQGYGILKGDTLKPAGWRLRLREGSEIHKLRYKDQAHFPNLRPGESLVLPIREGVLGVRVVQW